MSTQPSCGNCVFFSAVGSVAFPGTDGMCRRYAPQGPVIGSETNGWQIFPPMNSNQWCGDYRPDPHQTSAKVVAA